MPLILGDTFPRQATHIFMRVYLRHTKTNKYWFGPDEPHWTDNDKEAYDFRHTLSAVNFALTQHLRNVQVVLKFPEDEYDIVMDMEVGK